MSISTVTVLLVEDEEAMARSQAKLLRELGAVARLAADAATARECLESRVWDGVLVDVGLPDGSGLELLEDLRKTQPYVPVLVQSALPDQELPGQAYLHDAHFVYKPFGQAQLRAFVERIRARRQERRQRYIAVLARLAREHDVTEAERDVLREALEGRSYQQIAERRGTSVNTVKTQVRSLLQKTGTRSLTHLMSSVVSELLHERS